MTDTTDTDDSDPYPRAGEGPARTVGKLPGVAGVYVERHADVFCPDCAPDVVGQEIYERVKSESVGYDHDRTDELGNVAAVLASEEADCPGMSCGGCGIRLDTRVLHYEGVCRPDWCPEIDTDESTA